jgi:hypothetical protein
VGPGFRLSHPTPENRVPAPAEAEPDGATQNERRPRHLEREIASLTDALAQVGLSQALIHRLQEAEAQVSCRKAIEDLRNVPQARIALADLGGQMPAIRV